MRPYLRASAFTALSLSAALALTGCVGHTTAEPTATAPATLAPYPTSTAAVTDSASAHDALAKIVSASLDKALSDGMTQIGTNDVLTQTTVFDPSGAENEQEAMIDSQSNEASLALFDAKDDKYAPLGALNELKTSLAAKGTVVEQYADGSFRMKADGSVPVTVLNEKGLVTIVVTEYEDRGRWVDTFTYKVDAAGKKILADAVADSRGPQ